MVMVLFTALGDGTFSALALDRENVTQGQIWRLVTANWVHFGWPHTLMNISAFLLCSFAFFSEWKLSRFITLIFLIQIFVGVGIYLFNPEYAVYAGLSGAIHGYIVAGILLTERHNLWVKLVLTIGLFGKVLYEHRENYKATELQELLPVPVAYDAHLYGALAGLFIALIAICYNQFFSKK